MIGSLLLLWLGLLLTATLFMLKYCREEKLHVLFWLLAGLNAVTFLPVITSLVLHKDLVNSGFVKYSFIILLITLSITAIFFLFRKNNAKVSFAAATCLLFFSGTLWFAAAASAGLGETSLYRSNISADFYINFIRRNDNGTQYVEITKEKFGLVLNKYQGNIDGYVIPDSLRLTFHNDSVLRFSLFSGTQEQEIRIDTRFESVGSPHHGVSEVYLGSKRGAIDSTGKLIVPAEYDMLGDYYNGLILAYKDHKAGYIDINNKVVIPFRFDEGGNFLTDSTTVRIGQNYFYIDKNGTILSQQKNNP